MSREFKTRDYDATLNPTITLRDALPLNHLARFVVDVIALSDWLWALANGFFHSRGAQVCASGPQSDH
jgi:hypothetical protein